VADDRRGRREVQALQPGSRRRTPFSTPRRQGSLPAIFVAIAAQKDAAVKEALGIPGRERVLAVLKLGYPRTRFRRQAPRRTMETIWR